MHEFFNPDPLGVRTVRKGKLYAGFVLEVAQGKHSLQNNVRKAFVITLSERVIVSRQSTFAFIV